MYGYTGRGKYTARSSGRLYGRGKYTFKGVGRKLGNFLKQRALGTVVGGLTGGPAGAAAGFVGSGRYRQVSKNAMFSRNDTESTTLSKTEYIGDIYAPSTSGFVNTTYSLNPGLQQVFPWLSQIAQNYGEYEFKQLVFEYRPTIDASTVSNGQTGSIMMCTQYNADDVPFTDKEEMLKLLGSQSSKLTVRCLHGVECDPRKLNKSKHYTRSSPLIAGQDIKDYDHGTLNVAFVGTPATFFNQQLGELWVTTKVQLKKPQFYTNRGKGIQKDLWIAMSPSDKDQPFSQVEYNTVSSVFKGQQNNIGCAVVSGTNAAGVVIPGMSRSFTPLNAAKCTTIYFPDNFTGLVKIRLRMEATGLTGNMVGGGGFGIPTGNVFDVAAEWGSVTGAGPAQERQYQYLVGTQAEHVQNFYVKSATAGISNTVTFVSGLAAGSSGAGTSYIIEIEEQNPLFLRQIPSSNNQSSQTHSFVTDVVSGTTTILTAAAV